MSKLFATLKSKLLCALALCFAACLTLGLSFSVPAYAEENLIKYNLTLSNDLSVNFYANEAVGENAYITASVEGINGEKTIYANAGNAYKFTVTDLAPQLMSRKITVKLYNAAKELKGSNEITLSSYCKTLLDRGAAGNNMGEKEFKALSTLVVDLLNYGAAAQEYLGDTTYEKSNAFLTGEAYNSFVGGEYTMPAPSAFTATVADEATKANVKPTTAKLYLDYNVVAKIAFEVKDVAVDGVKALVGGNTVTANISSAAATTAGVTTYTASVPLSVLDIEKEVSVTLLSGEKEVGYTVKGSVSGYLSTRAANAEATDKTLALKLYSYAKSAAATLVTPTYTFGGGTYQKPHDIILGKHESKYELSGSLALATWDCGGTIASPFPRIQVRKENQFITFTLDFSEVEDKTNIGFSANMIKSRPNALIQVSADKENWDDLGYQQGNEDVYNSDYAERITSMRGVAVSDGNLYRLYYSLADYADEIGKNGLLYIRFGFTEKYKNSLSGAAVGSDVIDGICYYEKLNFNSAPPAKYALTLGNGLTFADGSKTAKLKELSTLPEVKFADESVDVKKVYYLASNGSAWKSNEFKMPNEDVTLKYVTVVNPYIGVSAYSKSIAIEKGQYLRRRNLRLCAYRRSDSQQRARRYYCN